jgi:tyrosine-protein phosphatase YwqE
MDERSNSRRPLFDLHCHILPDLDDGATSEEQALEVIALS